MRSIAAGRTNGPSSSLTPLKARPRGSVGACDEAALRSEDATRAVVKDGLRARVAQDSQEPAAPRVDNNVRRGGDVETRTQWPEGKTSEGREPQERSGMKQGRAASEGTRPQEAWKAWRGSAVGRGKPGAGRFPTFETLKGPETSGESDSDGETTL